MPPTATRRSTAYLPKMSEDGEAPDTIALAPYPAIPIPRQSPAPRFHTGKTPPFTPPCGVLAHRA
ncbi:hypothetical protein ASNO1_35050 [Corallococcus caeni]|uniref:Uncharacterized protein n=1 Tax=Corallococcus caeni TaxID=3082388 RepID=A0ABQ6QTT8_9BACT|nr:hypothetical protein ASNO1_35050 [Corallococcus sp. NO1]